MFMLGFPLLLVPFAIYNIVAFLMPGVSWTETVSSVYVISGADWTMSAGDMLVVLAILLLFGEIMKATRIGVRTVVDHALSLILFLLLLIFLILLLLLLLLIQKLPELLELFVVGKLLQPVRYCQQRTLHIVRDVLLRAIVEKIISRLRE